MAAINLKMDRRTRKIGPKKIYWLKMCGVVLSMVLAACHSSQIKTPNINTDFLKHKSIEEIRTVDKKQLDSFWRIPTTAEGMEVTDLSQKLIELRASDYSRVLVSQSTGRLLTD